MCRLSSLYFFEPTIFPTPKGRLKTFSDDLLGLMDNRLYFVP